MSPLDGRLDQKLTFWRMWTTNGYQVACACSTALCKRAGPAI